MSKGANIQKIGLSLQESVELRFFLSQNNITGNQLKKNLEEQLTTSELKNSIVQDVHKMNTQVLQKQEQLTMFQTGIQNPNILSDQFEDFIKGIPQASFKQIHFYDHNLDKSSHQIKQLPNQIPHISGQLLGQPEFKQQPNQKIPPSQISGLSSISLNQSDQNIQDLISPSSGLIHINNDQQSLINDSQDQLLKQLLRNEGNECEKQREVLSYDDIKPSQTQTINNQKEIMNFQQEKESIQLQGQIDQICFDNEEIAYDAGYGSFLKEMSYWAKDVSFQDQTHDIWNLEQEQKLNYHQDLSQASIDFKDSSLKKLQAQIQYYILQF